MEIYEFYTFGEGRERVEMGKSATHFPSQSFMA